MEISLQTLSEILTEILFSLDDIPHIVRILLSLNIYIIHVKNI